MNRTPLYDTHSAAGAKLVNFAGWEMPVQHSGVVDEYQTVRAAAGLFDVSHMGRVTVAGEGALAFLQRVTTNNVAPLDVLASQYSMVCNEQGGVKDDIFVYRVKPFEYLLCVNASNREKIVRWLREQAAGMRALTLTDRSAELAQLALQGPASRAILAVLNVPGLDALEPRRCLEARLRGAPALITRTGYTGELGYELYLPAVGAAALWQDLLRVGGPLGLKPAGLGARDLLRLEMAYLLYGNDIGEETTPLEAGAERVVAFDKGDFVGRAALRFQKEQELGRRLVAFELLEKGVPRHGFKILAGGEAWEPIGEVTSGNFSPILQKGIGLGYVPQASAKEGTAIAIAIRGRVVPALVVKPPFYRRGWCGG